MSLNHDLAAMFKTMAAILDIKGESPFKAIAFNKVSRILKDMTADLRQYVEQDRLAELEGVGASSQKIIEEYVKAGNSSDYDSLINSVPAGLLPMMDIPGMGPKTIALLWHERGITNIEELLKAIDSGGLQGLKGIGEKKIQAIKDGIAIRAQAGQRKGLPEARVLADALVERVRKLKGVKQAEVAGSLRRWRETIGDVDIVCAVADGTDGQAISDQFTQFPEVQRVLGKGAAKASVIADAGPQVDLRITPVEHFGAALLYFTGSKDHNVKIRGLALNQGMTLNEWGLYKLDEYERAEKKTAQAPAAAPVASKTEAEIYKKLGMIYVEPELREDRGEVEAARQKKLPNLIELADVKGDLHSHTNASDGVATIEQMAEAAIALGYEFLAITDHSKAQVIANGLSVERLLKHAAAVRKVNDRYKQITLFAGSEVDILADGRLDYDPEVLAELDFVVASPHVALSQDPQKATERIRRAVETRYVNVIGHPTGRVIDRRPGLPVDFAPVIQAAAKTGTALEINASYPRFDVNEIQARAAIEGGALLSVNTDAHSPEEFQSMVFGVTLARRGWATAGHVINCMTVDQLRKFISRKR